VKLHRDPAIESLYAALIRTPAMLERAEAALGAALAARRVFFGDKPLPTFVLPFFVEQRQLEVWTRHSTELAQWIDEIAWAALENPEIFAALRLRPDAQEWMRIDPGYRRIAVLARPDAVVGPDGPVFLEINCDSPAMMTFSDLVASCLIEIEPLAALKPKLRIEQMTPILLETLLTCYREFGGSASPPTIAITDWGGLKTRYEHQAIAQHFEAAGYPTIVCDPRAFRRSDGKLEVEGRIIHLVYRRALFTELLERKEEVTALIDAYRDGTICMVNSLRSYLASSKTLLAHLCERVGRDRAGLAGRIAATWMITPERAISLRKEPRRHVLKRAESHGGLHVLLPGLATEQAWLKAIEEAAHDPWIMQEEHPVPKLTVLERRGGEVVAAEKHFNWNPFLFGGRYAGGIARCSDTPLINITLGGGLLPTMIYG
jgi:hypothetical protein